MKSLSLSLILLVGTVAAVDKLIPINQAQPTERIVGGYYANDGQFPHQIALLKSGRFNCGGSIISPWYILSAAHCVQTAEGVVTDPRQLTVAHGAAYLWNGMQKQVSKTIPHENYGNFHNDIALVVLATPIQYDRFSNVIPLRQQALPLGGTVVISGFGRTGWDDPASEYLKYNQAKVISDTQCTQGTGITHPGLFCISSPEGNGACKGDSGGPAIYNGELVGVANFVIGGCGTVNPDGYAKVSHYLDWIYKNTKTGLGPILV